MTRVLVTGATGFVGGALARTLAARGDTVRAAVRGPQPAMALPPAVEARTVGDIGPDTDWAAALEGVDTVVHAAARVHVMRDAAADPPADHWAEHRRVNTEGTRRLAEAAAAAGVRRLVFLSTVKVNGETTAGTPFRESDPPCPGDPYGVSKREAEAALFDRAARTSLEVVAIRPPLVYGPGVKGNFRTLLSLVARGWPLPLGAVTGNRRSLIFLGNLVDAVMTALDHPQAAGQVYLVRDGEDVSTAGLIRRIAAALGRPARLWPVPAPVLRLAAGAAGRGAAAGRLLDSLAVDDGKIRRDLGWQPPFTLDAGLAATVARSAVRPTRRPPRAC